MGYTNNYRARDPYSVRTGITYDIEDDEWMQASIHGYPKYGGHPIRRREVFESKNDVVRKHYTAPDTMIINMLFGENI